MSKKIGQAIVIGGSVAGMLAARAIARHCESVTILERGKIRASLDMRAGVPQAAHIHAVVTKGRNLLEQAFPGIVDEVIADGAIMIDHINDRRRLASYGWQPRFPSELRMLLVSRPLLESHIRARVSRLSNVKIETGIRVQGLTAHEYQVTGVIASPVRQRGRRAQPGRRSGDRCIRQKLQRTRVARRPWVRHREGDVCRRQVGVRQPLL